MFTLSTNHRLLNALPFILVIAVTMCGFASLGFAQAPVKQLSLADILIALRSKKAVIEEKNRILTDAVKTRGITFTLTPEIEKELDSTGAHRILIDAIREKVAPVAEVKQAVKIEPAAVPQPVAKPVVATPTFESYRNSATLRFEKGEFEQAIVEIDKALAMRADDAEALTFRAGTNLKLDKTEPALADLNRSVELRPTVAAYVLRAGINEKQGRPVAAETDYRAALVIDPKNDQSLNAIARFDAAVAGKKAAEAKIVVPTVNAPVVPAGPFEAGALNDYAVRLVQPIYSDLDKKLGLKGKVVVQIALDENGKATSIQASSGPKSLKMSAEDAIKRTKFNPVMVDGKPTKATGFIVYNFVN